MSIRSYFVMQEACSEYLPNIHAQASEFNIPRYFVKTAVCVPVKLAQLVRRSLMVREVASSIPSGAVFAHVNIELA